MSNRSSIRSLSKQAVAAARFVLLVASLATAQVPAQRPELNDVHFHLTNYIQQGTNIHEFLKIMGSKVGRVAIRLAIALSRIKAVGAGDHFEQQCVVGNCSG